MKIKMQLRSTVVKMAAYKENLQASPQKQQSARSTKTQNWFKKDTTWCNEPSSRQH